MRTSLLLLTALLLTCRAMASHVVGADMRYEYTGSSYRIKLTYYGDCALGQSSGPLYVTLSSTCGSRTIPLSLDRVDSMYANFCGVPPGACNSPMGGPLYVVYHFSDTVTLPPCSDWKIAFHDVARNAGLNNLLNTFSQNIHVEAFLNNSTAPNSSPVFGNELPVVVRTGAVNNHYCQFLDIEGDSVSAQIVTPQQSAGTNVVYATGYSATALFGTPGSASLQPNGTLQLLPSNTGRYAMALRAHDYRNGTLVGYSSRDWIITSLPVSSSSNSSAPVPGPGNAFLATACPGGSNSLSLSFMDSVATDSVFIDVLPQNTYPYIISTNNGPGAATGNVTWVNPAGLDPVTTPYFFLKVKVRDNACPLQGSTTYTVLVRTKQCSPDSVWAGDANADYTVTMYDPLSVALAYGKTGPARTAASTAWMPQYCAGWAWSFNNNINYKHADCNGDGLVDTADLAVISANYGQFHLREGESAPQARGTGVPELYFDHSGVQAYPGATVTIPIRLGTAGMQMSNLYGLAAQLKVSGIAAGNPAVTYPSSWLGNATNTVRFSKISGAGSIDWAYARNDQQAVSGQGAIAVLRFTVPMGTLAGTRIILSMDRTRMIDATGAVITGYNVLSDTLQVTPAGVGTAAGRRFEAMILPNPGAHATLYLSGNSAGDHFSTTVTDMAGRVIWEAAQTGNQAIRLPEHLTSGVYFVRISDGPAAQTLKWTRP